MNTRLIELKDGTLVEIEVSQEQAQQISGGLATKVSTTFDRIQPILMNICRPISSCWKEVSKDMSIEGAEVEVGLSFEGEGNLYIAKSKSGAHLTIKLLLKPRRDSE